MCLVAILYRVIDDVPVLLAANREEAYARGGTAPDIRTGPRPYIAGLDPVAGGTWLGINVDGLIVAITNRPKSQRPESLRSRGLLVRDLLEQSSAREAMHVASRELASNHYAGCNLILADRDSLWVVHAGDWLRVRSLAPGFHIITNADVNDSTDDRIYWVMERLHDNPPRGRDDALALLQFVCDRPPICLHGSERGTVSSTLLALADRPRDGRLLHAQGPPDTTPYSDRTDLWWELLDRTEKEKR